MAGRTQVLQVSLGQPHGRKPWTRSSLDTSTPGMALVQNSNGPLPPLRYTAGRGGRQSACSHQAWTRHFTRDRSQQTSLRLIVCRSSTDEYDEGGWGGEGLNRLIPQLLGDASKLKCPHASTSVPRTSPAPRFGQYPLS